MTAYSDNVGASMEKFRSILAGGLNNGFSSANKDAKSAALSEEIVNVVVAEIEKYLADILSMTVD